MMKRKIIIIICLILFISMQCTIIYAEDLGLGPLTQYRGTNHDSPTLESMANNLLGIIRLIGVIASVVILIIIGIKYMMGSVEEKSTYKQTLKPYIIGAFILFTGSLLPTIIYEFATKNL